jgi:hypothetical protein
MRWVGHAARMEDVRNSHKILVEEYEEKKSLGKPRRRWKDIEISMKR